MGMYDEIKCKYSLPDKEVQDETFQTKDFACVLGAYTITKEGKLICHTVRTEVVPEEERPYFGKPGWDRGMNRLIGSMRSIPTGDVEIPFHGDLRFYTDLRDKDKNTYVWYEYKARFTDSTLVSIQKA